VLVALGHPDLEEQFELPPMRSAEINVEETMAHKLIQVKLRKKRPPGNGRRRVENGQRGGCGKRETILPKQPRQCKEITSEKAAPVATPSPFSSLALSAEAAMLAVQRAAVQRAPSPDFMVRRLTDRSLSLVSSTTEGSDRVLEAARQNQYGIRVQPQQSYVLQTTAVSEDPTRPAEGETEEPDALPKQLHHGVPDAIDVTAESSSQELGGEAFPPRLTKINSACPEVHRNRTSPMAAEPTPFLATHSMPLPKGSWSDSGVSLSAALPNRPQRTPNPVDPGSPKMACPGSHNPWGEKKKASKYAKIRKHQSTPAGQLPPSPPVIPRHQHEAAAGDSRLSASSDSSGSLWVLLQDGDALDSSSWMPGTFHLSAAGRLVVFDSAGQELTELQFGLPNSCRLSYLAATETCLPHAVELRVQSPQREVSAAKIAAPSQLQLQQWIKELKVLGVVIAGVPDHTVPMAPPLVFEDASESELSRLSSKVSAVEAHADIESGTDGPSQRSSFGATPREVVASPHPPPVAPSFAPPLPRRMTSDSHSHSPSTPPRTASAPLLVVSTSEPRSMRGPSAEQVKASLKVSRGRSVGDILLPDDDTDRDAKACASGTRAASLGDRSNDTRSRSKSDIIHSMACSLSPVGTDGSSIRRANSLRAPTTPLKDRRKLRLDMPATCPTGRPAEKSSEELESNPPAVIGGTPRQDSMPWKQHRVAAFPHRKTLIILDWDDTLCPTTWIRNLLKEHMADSAAWIGEERKEDWHDKIPAWFGQPLPDNPDVRDSIEVLQTAIIDFFKVAQSLGVLCIITNAFDGWVGSTTKKWLPQLKQYIFGHGSRPPISCLYAQREYKHPPAASLAAQLPCVCEPGELMLWKKAAMMTALEKLDQLYRVAPERNSKSNEQVLSQTSWTADQGDEQIWNVISIGDSTAEIQAAELAAHSYVNAFPVPATLEQNASDAPTAASSSSATSGAASAQQNPSQHQHVPGVSEWRRRRSRRAYSLPGVRDRRMPFIKTVKLDEEPVLSTITDQLLALTKALPQIVAARTDLALSSVDLRGDTAGGAGGGKGIIATEEMKLRRSLRTQVV